MAFCTSCGGDMRLHSRGQTRAAIGANLPKQRLVCSRCGRTKTAYDDGQPWAGHRIDRNLADKVVSACLTMPASAVAREYGCDPKTVRSVFSSWIDAYELDFFSRPPGVVALVAVALCSDRRLMVFDAERMALRDILPSIRPVDAEKWRRHCSPGLVFIEPDRECLLFAQQCWPGVPVAVDVQSFLVVAARIVESSLKSMARTISPETSKALMDGFPSLMRDVPFRSAQDIRVLDAWEYRHPELDAMRRAKDSFWGVFLRHDADMVVRAWMEWKSHHRGATGRLLWKLREMADVWMEHMLPFLESGLLLDWASSLHVLRTAGMEQAARLGTRRYEAMRAALLYAHGSPVPTGLALEDIADVLAHVAASQRGA